MSTFSTLLCFTLISLASAQDWYRSIKQGQRTVFQAVKVEATTGDFWGSVGLKLFKSPPKFETRELNNFIIIGTAPTTVEHIEELTKTLGINSVINLAPDAEAGAAIRLYKKMNINELQLPVRHNSIPSAKYMAAAVEFIADHPDERIFIHASSMEDSRLVGLAQAFKVAEYYKNGVPEDVVEGLQGLESPQNQLVPVQNQFQQPRPRQFVFQPQLNDELAQFIDLLMNMRQHPVIVPKEPLRLTYEPIEQSVSQGQQPILPPIKSIQFDVIPRQIEAKQSSLVIVPKTSLRPSQSLTQEVPVQQQLVFERDISSPQLALRLFRQPKMSPYQVFGLRNGASLQQVAIANEVLNEELGDEEIEDGGQLVVQQANFAQRMVSTAYNTIRENAVPIIITAAAAGIFSFMGF